MMFLILAIDRVAPRCVVTSMRPLSRQLPRRLLLRSVPALAVVSPVLAGDAVRTWLSPLPPSASAQPIKLRGVPRSVVRTASIPLDGHGLIHARDTGEFLSELLEASSFKMAAVTWVGDGGPLAVPAVRTRTDGHWTAWRDLEPLRDLPDPGTAEGNGLRGTDLLWVGESDGIQVSVRGPRPRRLALQLIDPGVLASDTLTASRPVGRTAVTAKPAPRPELRYRKQWGADESWRNGGPYYGRTLQQVHIHHTATGNEYTRADVPALIRGIYRYHTHTLGWSDIGYNFLIDRFGRTWVGRAGGPAKVVRGAHTLGFNHTSTGIAVIGNYEDASPTDKVINAIVGLAAWKLDAFHRKPTGTARVYSHGSDKYPAGTWVRLPVIDGHRDTNATACPGENLYAQLKKIRNRTQKRVDARTA
jgi:N-acetylmuramoyl-L-alanine amidase